MDATNGKEPEAVQGDGGADADVLGHVVDGAPKTGGKLQTFNHYRQYNRGNCLLLKALCLLKDVLYTAKLT